MVNENVKIFSGTSNRDLAERVSKELNIPLGDAKIVRFKDGEVYVKLNSTVRGATVFVIQTTSNPVNENLPCPDIGLYKVSPYEIKLSIKLCIFFLEQSGKLI